MTDTQTAFVLANYLLGDAHRRIEADRAIIAGLRAEVERLQSFADGYGKLDADFAIAERRAEAAEARVKELEGALTPSAETKAAYMGEFTIAIERVVNIDDEPDDEAEGATDPYEHISVPWRTIKEIMTAIRALASKKETVDERPA